MGYALPVPPEFGHYFEKEHRCETCGKTWTDVWDCLCNDDCPECGAEIEPHRARAIDKDTKEPIDQWEDC
jgi:hypothetical protein